MFAFLIRKMIKNKWMIISLIIGNILLLATVASVPLYSNATLQRMLLKEMQEYQLNRNTQPGLVELRYTYSYSAGSDLSMFNYIRNELNVEMDSAFGIPILEMIECVNLANAIFYPEIQREEKPSGRSALLTAYTELDRHITITQGSMFSNGIRDGVLEAIVTQRTLEELDLLLGETLIDEKREIYGQPLRIKVVGVFENSSENDPYWTSSPNFLSSNLIIDHSLLEELVLNEIAYQFRIEVIWQHVYDYNAMEVRKVSQYTAADKAFKEYFEKTRFSTRYKNNFIPLISTYQAKADSLAVTLWVLQVPVFILLAFFIFMVSRQILVIEQNDISVIKSRGASRRQIVSLYFWQSIIILMISAPISFPLGVFICRVLGSSNGFLNLIQRSALKIALVPEAFIYSGFAILFSLLTMTVPVIGYSRVTIVDHKRTKSTGRRKPIWQRFFLDILALAVASYSLYTFNNRASVYASAVNDLNAIDPLLFLSSSLFIIGLGLVLLRVYPYLIRFIFAAFKRLWSPAFYASFIKLIRSGGDEQFIMIFLVFTLAVGIFDAKAARTINLNNEDKINYTLGADLTFREVWSDNTSSEPDAAQPSVILYQEPDFEKFTGFDEVTSIAKVFKDKVTVSLTGGQLANVTLMGVNTQDFGRTAWYRDDLFAAHFYDYLNAMATNSASVLLSANFRDTYGYKINDVITYKDKRGNYVQSPIHGFVDYWPGFLTIEKTKGTDGRVIEKENWLIVSNLHYLQAQNGLMPYEIWMKTSGDSNRFIYDFAEATSLRFVSFTDSKTEIVKGRNDPLLQGLNGVLTVGFIIIIVICAAGFLIYWILAIKSRVLQFGIFRAMGMGLKSIIGILVIEQVFITGAAIGLGVTAGEVSSRLFVPIIQLAYTASEKVIPFKIVTETRDYLNLLSITGIMIVACLLVLCVLISKIKITQALKLGED